MGDGKRNVVAYAITHAPRGQKGGPYEARFGPRGTATTSLRKAERWDPPEDREDAESSALFAAVIKTIPHARVVGIVRKVKS